MFEIMGKLRLLCFVCLAMLFAARASSQIIRTVAGGGPNNIPARSAGIFPGRLTLDASGYLYIATGLFNNNSSTSNVVFRVDQNGQLTVYAGGGFDGLGDGGPATSAELCDPQGIAFDTSGNLFIADECNDRVRRVDAITHVITTVAGNGTVGFSGDGGPATAATLHCPDSVAVDSSGNLFIADGCNLRVRRVDATTQVITTVAGGGTVGSVGDGGPATSASLGPIDVAVDRAGNLFIADYGNLRVRRVDAATQVITTVVGDGTFGYSGDGGPATSAEMRFPTGVRVDSAGNLFIDDSYNGTAIRRVDAATQVISTIAGTGTQTCQITPSCFSGDGGPATSAEINEAEGIALDSAGNLYIADTFNYRVRRVDAATQVIDTIAGNGTTYFGGDGSLATSAQVSPGAVALDSAGNLLIGDAGRVRRVDAGTQIITTYAGGGTDPFADGVPAVSALLGVFSIALDRSENLFISSGVNVVRRVDAAAQTIATVAGQNSEACYPCLGSFGDGGPATSAWLDHPEGLAVDQAGNLFVADWGNFKIRRVDATTQVITTVAGNGTPGFSGDGGPATAATLGAEHGPLGVALDGAGNLFIADGSFHRIRRVDAATGIITTVAGTGSPGGFSGDGGPATSAQLFGPGGVVVDSAGNLFIADSGNNRIRRVDAATGVITTVVGNGTFGFNGDGELATSAELAAPSNVALDSSGNLFIADSFNNRIREVVMSNQGPQSQTITFTPIANRTFAPGDAFALSATASSGLPVTFTAGAADNCTIFGTTVQITGAGTCTVTAHQDGNSSFNAASDVAHTFSIGKATAAINLGNQTPTYNGQPQSAAVGTTPSGLAVSVTYNGSAGAPSNAGSYAVVATVNDANYQGAGSATFTIKPAPLTIAASSMTKILGAAMPSFTASYSGFVNGENASALSGALSCTTTTAASSGVGSYPITCGGQSSANYAVSYVSGTLRVLYAPTGQACYIDAGHTILPPINANGTSVWNQGRIVPAQFRVCDANGVSVRTPGVVAGFHLIGVISGTSSTSMDGSVASTSPDAQFRWDATNQQWIFNISTRGLAAGNTYIYQVLLNDGTTITFQFGLR